MVWAGWSVCLTFSAHGPSINRGRLLNTQKTHVVSLMKFLKQTITDTETGCVHVLPPFISLSPSPSLSSSLSFSHSLSLFPPLSRSLPPVFSVHLFLFLLIWVWPFQVWGEVYLSGRKGNVSWICMHVYSALMYTLTNVCTLCIQKPWLLGDGQQVYMYSM